jgi:hypothetical protein
MKKLAMHGDSKDYNPRHLGGIDYENHGGQHRQKICETPMTRHSGMHLLLQLCREILVGELQSRSDPISKLTNIKRARRVTQVMECLHGNPQYRRRGKRRRRSGEKRR